MSAPHVVPLLARVVHPTGTELGVVSLETRDDEALLHVRTISPLSGPPIQATLLDADGKRISPWRAGGAGFVGPLGRRHTIHYVFEGVADASRLRAIAFADATSARSDDELVVPIESPATSADAAVEYEPLKRSPEALLSAERDQLLPETIRPVGHVIREFDGLLHYVTSIEQWGRSSVINVFRRFLFKPQPCWLPNRFTAQDEVGRLYHGWAEGGGCWPRGGTSYHRLVPRLPSDVQSLAIHEREGDQPGALVAAVEVLASVMRREP